MVSQQQLEANRANARRSTGPRTTEGKSRSKMNALTHGLSAKAIVIGDEKPEDFEALRDAVIAHYQPNTAFANDAADRYAATLWRLRRIPAIEAAFAATACERAYAEECDRLEQKHEEEIDLEAQERCDAEYDNEESEILLARMSGVHQQRVSEISDELLSERPFCAPEKEPLPVAHAFRTLIEAADSFDILGKLNRYEVALMNIASRQRKELEGLRPAGDDAKIIDL
jgi:hypothetical protein